MVVVVVVVMVADALIGPEWKMEMNAAQSTKKRLQVPPLLLLLLLLLLFLEANVKVNCLLPYGLNEYLASRRLLFLAGEECLYVFVCVFCCCCCSLIAYIILVLFCL